MSHDSSRHSLLLITRNKINLFFSLSITRNFIFFLPTNQSTFTYPRLRKLSSLTTLQRHTKDGGVAATRSSIHIAHHPTKNGGVAAIRPSTHLAHHPTRDGGITVMRSSIYIAHHLLSYVWSSWTLNVATQ